MLLIVIYEHGVIVCSSFLLGFFQHPAKDEQNFLHAFLVS